MDSLHNQIFLEGLFNHIMSAVLDRLHRQGNIGMGGQDDDGNVVFALVQNLLQLHARHPRHAHVENNAADAAWFEVGQKLVGTIESDQLQAGRF